MKRIVGALQQVNGINKAASHNLGQVEVEYDENRLTTMDLIRTVREQGFLAGML
jgi:hypothetical protein